MKELTAKVCILGDFAVGKTSTVERFVNSHFSDKYLTTIGVKVDTRDLLLPQQVSIRLVLWDVAGTDRFGAMEFAYLRGASGFIFVADGTRPDTVDTARKLKEQSHERYGDTPSVMLLNKSDLTDDWKVTDTMQASLKKEFSSTFVTSAKTGNNVDEAMTQLGSLVVERDFSLSS